MVRSQSFSDKSMYDAQKMSKVWGASLVPATIKGLREGWRAMGADGVGSLVTGLVNRSLKRFNMVYVRRWLVKTGLTFDVLSMSMMSMFVRLGQRM